MRSFVFSGVSVTVWFLAHACNAVVGVEYACIRQYSAGSGSGVSARNQQAAQAARPAAQFAVWRQDPCSLRTGPAAGSGSEHACAGGGARGGFVSDLQAGDRYPLLCDLLRHERRLVVEVELALLIFQFAALVLRVVYRPQLVVEEGRLVAVGRRRAVPIVQAHVAIDRTRRLQMSARFARRMWRVGAGVAWRGVA